MLKYKTEKAPPQSIERLGNVQCSIINADITTYLIDLVRMLSQRTHMYAWYRHISSSDIPPLELAGLLLFLNKIEYFFQAAIHYQNWHKLKSLLTAACGVSSVIKQHKCRCKQMVLVLTFGSPSWTRTNDPAVNSRMLYRLSYWGTFVLLSHFHAIIFLIFFPLSLPIFTL